MGLDYGSKTVGVAVSDRLGLTAQGVETITRELSRIGNNLNQLTRYFHMGGLVSAAMQEQLRNCINDVMDMRKEVMKLGGDYRGYTKTHRK